MASLWGKIASELKATYKFRHAVFAFASTTLRLRYRRSFLGLAWSLLAPMLNYGVVGFVFSKTMRVGVDNYMAYFFSGALIFGLMSACIQAAPYIFIHNEAYIRKIYVPKMVFALNSVFVESINFLLGGSALVILGLVFGRLHPGWVSLTCLVPLGLAIIFLIGFVPLLGILSVFFRDIAHIVPVIMQAFFFLTPVLYEKTVMPQQMQDLLRFNPFHHFVAAFRDPIVYGRLPGQAHLLACCAMALFTFFTGLAMMKKYENKIVFKL